MSRDGGCGRLSGLETLVVGDESDAATLGVHLRRDDLRRMSSMVPYDGRMYRRRGLCHCEITGLAFAVVGGDHRILPRVLATRAEGV